MWHEARKQERKIRGMMVDYRRRAERRRDFYEKIKADPTQFLQLHGRQCKIHLDPCIASAADSPATMMPWQGQADNLIDRFDVRAHLDYIPPVQNQEEEDLTYEERQINYERYRIIAQNSFLSISEEKFLKQLHIEEQFGYMEPESKKKKPTGAAIGFNYEDGTGYSMQSSSIPADDNSDGNSDSDLDVDLYINVSKVDQYQAHELNKHGLTFGMSSNDLYSFLTDDMEEAESNRLAREEEHEKALFSGRKSRRERRAHREKRLANRILSPPSYAARSSPTYPTFRDSNSDSRSPSPANTGKITYITSFGDDDEAPTTSKPSSNKTKRDKKVRRHADSSPDNRVVVMNYSDRDKSYRRKRRSTSLDSRNLRLRRRSRSRSRSRRRSRSRDRYRRRPYSRLNNRSRYRRSSSSSSYGRRTHSRSRGRNISYSRSGNSRRYRSSSSSSSSHSSSVSRKSSHSISRKIKSRSPSLKRDSPPKIAVQRYYGRKRSDQSSSSDSDNSSGIGENRCSNNVVGVNPGVVESNAITMGNADPASKKSTPVCITSTMSVQERLKRKRQALLNKQYKADKLAEQQKTEREKQEQQNREDELREMAIKLRRRRREMRHAHTSDTSSSCDSDSRSNVSSKYKPPRSRSRSPKDRKDDVDYWSKERRFGEKERTNNRKGRNSTSSDESSPSSNDDMKDEKTTYKEKEKDRRWDKRRRESRDS